MSVNKDAGTASRLLSRIVRPVDTDDWARRLPLADRVDAVPLDAPAEPGRLLEEKSR